SDVQVTWSVTDPGSDVVSSSGCDATSIVTDTAGTILSCTASSEGGESSGTVTVKRDVTAPTLALPSGPGVDATRPRGAAVSFTAAAADAIDPSPAVACTPRSGETFPIGATTVACTAGDAAGNTAQGSFSVLVRGAAAQLDALRGQVSDLGTPGKSFEA